MTCEKCRFMYLAPNEGLEHEVYRQCRRRSPAPTWPWVKLADWCGEYEPKAEHDPGSLAVFPATAQQRRDMTADAFLGAGLITEEQAEQLRKPPVEEP